MYSLDSRRPMLVGDGHFVAPNATLIGSVRLEANANIWFGCVLRGDNDWIVIGAGSNIQDGCVLHTDPGIPLHVGRSVTVGHNAMLHGCTIGDNTLVGIGCSILNYAKIGANSIVGANSLVTEGREYPDGVLLLGSPAKPVRELNKDEIRFNTWSAEHYVQNGQRYLAELRECDISGN
jgi:carbonic anhydrase/acetyltransferase-like protein (isoleucine patch superfamily)